MSTISLFHEILQYTIQAQASDLHLASEMVPIMRIHGNLIKTMFPVLSKTDIQMFLDDIMTENIKKDFQINWETDFSFTAKTYAGVRFRVNAFRQLNGISAVLRIIPSTIQSLDDLQMPEIIKKIALLSSGLVLITGPAGSGKSTTLASIVDYINTNTQGHIITIEDPIEFTHSSKNCLINQREVFRDTKSFNQALRSALREDPNVILVGELRDLETIRLAMTAAETGHLILATLHTRSAEKTIHRLVDVFPGDEKNTVRTMLSESLEAIIAQTLVNKIGGGRIATLEIMLGTPAIRHLIREDKTAQMVSVMQTGGEMGMQTLAQHVEKLKQQKIILS